MSLKTYADCIRHWGELTAAIAANPELAHLEPDRALLAADLEGFLDLTVRQANLRRQTQETSRELADLSKRGRYLATRLRDSVRGFYGRDGEMLVEFRLQPRRPRSRPTSTPTPPPAPEIEKPSELGSTPARTAAPETDAST
jgi:hypothetical protein